MKKTTHHNPIEHLLTRGVNVPVAPSSVITLIPPSVDVSMKLRRQATSIPDLPAEKQQQASLELAAAAYLATFDEPEEHKPPLDEAIRFILATGGEMGKLSRTAMKLCGLVGADFGETEEDNKIPFS